MMKPLSQATMTQDVLSDPSVRFYLKDTIRLFATKDPVDAVNDAELLLLTMKARLEALSR